MTARNQFFKWAFLLLSMVSCGFIQSGAANESSQIDRPNFVFIITDDISPDDLPLYGNDKIKTPHLDQLAKRGLVFDNAFLTTSSCSPSRCSIITGRYPHNTGAPELHMPLPATQKTFIQLFRDAGYHTILSGKNHMGKPKTLGFDVANDGSPSGSEKWVKNLKERPKGKPFFAWYASHDAHFAFKTNEFGQTIDPKQIDVPPMLFDGDQTRESLAGFYHEVSRTDHYTGEVVRELEKQGVLENTYIVYCSDNGRPFPRCKTFLYDSGIQTPLIIAGPKVKSGRTHSLVSSIDFSATFLELAGLEKPKTIQGQSFQSILLDVDAEVRKMIFSERNWHVFRNHARAVRTKQWLYIRNAWPDRPALSLESSQRSKFPAAEELWAAAESKQLTPAQALMTSPVQPTEMLFDVQQDPHQFQNLANDANYQTELRQLRNHLDQWIDQTGDSIPEDPTPDRQGWNESKRVKNFGHREVPGQIHSAESILLPGPM